MSARRRLVLAVLLLGSAAGVPALAASSAEPVVVAREGNVTLVASDDDERLCIGIQVAGETQTVSCSDPEDGIVADAGESDRARLVGVAAPAPAASVEIRRAGQVLGAAATVAGEAYTGKAAGKVRFALVRLAPGALAGGLRAHALDAAGGLLRVFSGGGDELVSGRRRLLRGRRGPVSFSLEETRSSSLEPSVLDPARETVSRCLEVTVRSTLPDTPEGFTTTDCTSGDPRESLFRGAAAREATQQDACRPHFRLLHGTVDASVQRVTVLLGDGRRRTARTAPLRDGGKVYALAVSPADAVRGVTLHRAGDADRFRQLALAPVPVLCGVTDDVSPILFGGLSFVLNSLDDLPAVTPAGPVTTLPGPPVARVADGPGETLCVAIGDRPFTALGCAIVEPLPGELLAAFDTVYGPHAFVLAVPARVATVRFRGADGAIVLTIPTVAGTGYAGRYAGAVRFASAAVADFSRLATLELLDAGGQVVDRETDTNVAAPVRRQSRPRRVAGRVGGPSLWQTTLRFGEEATRCLKLTAGPRPPADDACDTVREKESVLLSASCATRRLTVAVATRPGTRVLAGTGAAAPRRIRLRAGAGLLTLRPGTRLRSLTFIRRAGTRRLRLNAPPAARQCGWGMATDVPAR